MLTKERDYILREVHSPKIWRQPRCLLMDGWMDSWLTGWMDEWVGEHMSA